MISLLIFGQFLRSHVEFAYLLYGASSIETRHLAKNFNFLFISKIYSTISIRCRSVISSIFQKIARCRVSIDEAPYSTRPG